eukprot:737327_1
MYNGQDFLSETTLDPPYALHTLSAKRTVSPPQSVSPPSPTPSERKQVIDERLQEKRKHKPTEFDLRGQPIAYSESPKKTVLPESWQKYSKITTRAELDSLRRTKNMPDLSFDLDGDGVVDQSDYFFSNLFDKDRDGKLNKNERLHALNGIKENIKDKYLLWPEGMKPATDTDLANRNQGWFPMNEILKSEGRNVLTRTKLLRNRRSNLIRNMQRAKDRWSMYNPPTPRPAEIQVTGQDYIAKMEPGTLKSGKTYSSELENRRRVARKAGGLCENSTEINPERPGPPQYTKVHLPKCKTKYELDKLRRSESLNRLKEVEGETMKYYRGPLQRRKEKEDRWFRIRQSSKPGHTLEKLKKTRLSRIHAETEPFGDIEEKRISRKTVFAGKDDPFWKTQNLFPGPTGVSYSRLMRSRMLRCDVDDLNDETYEKDPFKNEHKIERVRSRVTGSIGGMPHPTPPPIDLKLPRRTSLAQIAQAQGVPTEELAIMPSVESTFEEDPSQNRAEPFDMDPLFSSFAADKVFHEPKFSAKPRSRHLKLRRTSIFVENPKVPRPQSAPQTFRMDMRPKRATEPVRSGGFQRVRGIVK